ncbi:MAG: AAA family ATPase, partial [Candidatus Poribacteria bacterium]|nr:AAA family ATPase [Candidatus Poribacteria bacterium]
MITHIRMRNFKSWKDSGEVKLAPLTGFFGTNSSGKSSLLQMLLLLKQTVGRDEVIFFGDETSLVNLGSFGEVIHGHSKEELLELEFGSKLRNSLTIRTLQSDPYSRSGYSYQPLDIDHFTFDTAIRENSGSLFVEYFSYIIGPEPIEKIKCKDGHLYYGDMNWDDVNAANIY